MHKMTQKKCTLQNTVAVMAPLNEEDATVLLLFDHISKCF